jgi:hypothetical protein
MTENQLPPRKTNAIFYALIILLLLGIVGYQFYLIMKDREIIDQNEEVIAEKSGDLDRVSVKLDSMRNELGQKLQELIRLKGDTTSIAKLKREIERDLLRSRQKNKASLELIGILEDKVAIYEDKLIKKDQEIEDLRYKFNLASKENSELKNTMVEKEEKIQKQVEEINTYRQKVEIAKKLKAESIRISMIDSKGREKEEEDFKAKKISRLKVSFRISDNPIADKSSREVFMRITGPEGAVLGDPASGGGSFQYEGRESPYTSRLSFLFDNVESPPPFLWEKGSQFSTGTYTVELFTEGYKLGQAYFKVK